MKTVWLKDFPAAVTVCDASGIIIEMNEKSADLFSKYGGYDLLGKQLLDCHPPHAQEILKRMLEDHSENYYMTEKHGQKKLIIQLPWYDGQQFMGLVEIVKEISDDIAFHKR